MYICTYVDVWTLHEAGSRGNHAAANGVRRRRRHEMSWLSPVSRVSARPTAPCSCMVYTCAFKGLSNRTLRHMGLKIPGPVTDPNT